MLKYNCSENTKFPNLKFTCKGDKDKFAGIILNLNPSKEKFSGTRQELPESFKNKFISTEFPEMKREELYAITDGTSKDCQQFIDDLFHFIWNGIKTKKFKAI